VARIVGGLAIPFMRLRIWSLNKIRINPHGLVALLLILLMLGIAFFYNWSLDWLSWLDLRGAIALYGAACLPYVVFKDLPGRGRRSSLGKHLAFFFLRVGFGLHFKNGIAIIGFFIASIAAGLVIPYLLLRDS
jgi:hypothetical protein